MRAAFGREALQSVNVVICGEVDGVATPPYASAWGEIDVDAARGARAGENSDQIRRGVRQHPLRAGPTIFEEPRSVSARGVIGDHGPLG